MDKEKQIEEMALTEVDILANDLNQHCADLAENYCGDTTCLTCLAHALTAKGYRKASEVAREIFEEFHNMLLKIIRVVDDELEKAIRNNDEEAKFVPACTKETLQCVMLCLDELKKKYIGKDTNATTKMEEGK
jgi:hypothetical protein